MACEILEYNRVILVLWGKPEFPDVEKILSRITAAYASVGPIVFIARVPVKAAAPDDKMRKEISRILPSIVGHCASYHAVFEGAGFMNSAKRAVLSTMFLMSTKRKRYHVHSSTQEVAAAVSPELQNEVIKALDHFRSHGVLDHNMDSLPPRVSAPFARGHREESANALMTANAGRSVRHHERGR
jgi:hypothetical protein